ncbi:protein GAMETE EXPRESSED 3 [Daucus carota subsp. sativus]|uniref:protein GAMETE EXPRESSED 3 n=1 Tax=Daucus carota subsp. sativus TaxID=79200 RepID=UPI0007B30BFB
MSHLVVVLILVLLHSLAFFISHSTQFPNYPSSFTAQEPLKKGTNRLSNPLIGEDGRVYICMGKSLLAFENNGTTAWTLPLGYSCNLGMAPVSGASSTLYVVAENRVMKINLRKIGTSESALEVFFGPESGEIIGLSVSTTISCIAINVKNRALFAFRLHGKPLWSAGPVIYQNGYRQGCRRSTTDCYFTSVPVIDQCEASIYISNNQGELYSLSVRTPHFKWIQDLSSLDKNFTATPGNNGRLYVTLPARSLLLALHVSTGTILWQKPIGPLSRIDYKPTVDSNGWVSVGSLDGFLYSFSPTGDLKKFPKRAAMDSVIQDSPSLHCSGSAVYVSQTVVEGKLSHTIGESTYISAMKPTNVVFTLLVPATGSIYWSESYPGPSSSLLSKSDLQHFVLDERVLLAFLSASGVGRPLPCRSTRQKLASSCSQTMPKLLSIYTGNEKAVMLFLVFESIVLIIVAALVRFCCIFWGKKKLQGQDLGKFLEKRRSLQLQKKAYDRTITELERKAAEEAVDNEVLENLGHMVRAKAGIERKLSTTYSLGRDRPGVQPKSILPLYNRRTKSFSFRSTNKENATTATTPSDSSSEGCSICEKASRSLYTGPPNKGKAPMEVVDNSSDDENAAKSLYTGPADKGKAPVEVVDSSSGDESYGGGHESVYTDSTPGSNLFINPLFNEHAVNEEASLKIHEEGEPAQESGSRSIRRRTFSSSE